MKRVAKMTNLQDKGALACNKKVHEASTTSRPLGHVGRQLPDESALPPFLIKRDEDGIRYTLNKKDRDMVYTTLVATGCSVHRLPSEEDTYPRELNDCHRTGVEELEAAGLKSRQLAFKLQAKIGTGDANQATAVDEECGGKAAEMPEEAQEQALLVEEQGLQCQLDLCSSEKFKCWVETRVEPTREALGDLRDGRSMLSRGSDVGSWELFSLAGGYQHLWRTREAYEAALEGAAIEDSPLRGLMLEFLGLRRAHQTGSGEVEAMKLFHALAKIHHAVGADVIPDAYLVYHTMCAQLYGNTKAAAILFAPLTEEELEALENCDLSSVYESHLMQKMWGEMGRGGAHVGGWSEEEMREVHVRRLRGPWGRLYAKELGKVRQLLPTLEAPLPDMSAHRAALEQRLSEIRTQLSTLEKSVDHVVCVPSSSQKAKTSSSLWRRVLSFLSRLRGSVASKLRKLRDRLWGKRDHTAEAVAHLRKQLQVARAQVEACAKRVWEERRLLELDEALTGGLKGVGEVRAAVEAMVLSTWDMQDDIKGLRTAGGRGSQEQAGDAMACMLLRVCYLDVDHFFEDAMQDVEKALAQLKNSFNKGFKLRRKGHTDRLQSMRGLVAEEKSLLNGLCAGMDNAQEWLVHYVNQRFNNNIDYFGF